MRMADQQFYSHLFPFADPTCLVHAQDLTDAEVVSMHHEDAALEVIKSNDEELPTTASLDPSQLSQQPTQQSSLCQRSESTDPLPAPSLLQSGSTKQPAPLLVPVTTLSPVPSRPRRERTNRPGSIPLDDVPIQQLSDSKLARALVENKVVLELPDTSKASR
eukprot:1929525-Rhodomonas_salina.2